MTEGGAPAWPDTATPVSRDRSPPLPSASPPALRGESYSELSYSHTDVTADWDAPARVWEQFCAEINIVHVPIADPVVQGRLMT